MSQSLTTGWGGEIRRRWLEPLGTYTLQTLSLCHFFVSDSVITQPSNMAAVDIVHSTTHYLARDKLYDTEKPFSLRFTAPEDFPRSNIKLEKHDIEVRDLRKSEMMSFEKHGCTVVNLRSMMTHSDFDNDELVKEIYLKEVANYLKDFLDAQHVQIFEHTVLIALSLIVSISI